MGNCQARIPLEPHPTPPLGPAFCPLTGRCCVRWQANFSLVSMYELCRVVRIFDPTVAATLATPASVDELSAVRPLLALGHIPNLKVELPLHLAAAAQAPTFDRGDIAAYTEGVLAWWRINGGSFKHR